MSHHRFTCKSFTCSTIEASRPKARPHSSPRVTTALPNLTTILLAWRRSLRWAKDLPCARASGTVKKGTLLHWRTAWCVRNWEEEGSAWERERGKHPMRSHGMQESRECIDGLCYVLVCTDCITNECQMGKW